MSFSRAVGTLAGAIVLAGRAVAGRSPHSLSPRQLLPRIAADQKRIWSFPLTVARGNGWKPALGVIGATAALIALDPIDTPWLQQVAFQQTPAILRLNRILSGRNTAIAINTVPPFLYLAGMIRGESYLSQSALLAAEAVANAEIVSTAMKHADRRMRPREVGPTGNFSNTWFRTKSRDIGGAGCFPSGHTAAAFAVATVFAERYRDCGWIPPAAYGLACIVALSRLNARAHFPSDVFFGAVLGYSISHGTVLRR